LEQVAAIRTREEIEEALRAFSRANLSRLEKAANYFARYPLEPKDLLQKAYVLALTTRNCSADVDVVTFLIGIMRSVAHGEGVKTKNRLVTVPIGSADDPEDGTVDPPDPSMNMEDNLIVEERLATIRASILSLFDEGSQAWYLAEGIMEDLTADELRDMLTLDKTAYDSMRKLFRRRVDKAYPGGWNHDRE
jgi:hypothetical protein